MAATGFGRFHVESPQGDASVIFSIRIAECGNAQQFLEKYTRLMEK